MAKEKVLNKISAFDDSQKVLLTTEDLKEFEYGIDSEDLPYIMMILRTKIYSDKILAVVREYSTNAIDAHIEACIPETPITVTLPTQVSPQFSVRDYGYGLDEEKMRKLYIRFGKSGSRQDINRSGALGLGCKSGFSYSDSFTIESYQHGQRTVYVAQVDSKNMGKLLKLEECDTTEPDGIKVIIDVKTKDISTFREKALVLYQYFKVHPNIINLGTDNIYKYNKILEGNNWFITKNSSRSIYKTNDSGRMKAIMGNIGYELSSSSTVQISDSTLESLLNCSKLYVYFDNGTLDFEVSRENLEYTEHTKKNIKKRLVEISQEISTVVSKDLTICHNLFEATIKAHQINDSLFGVLESFVKNMMVWNNIPINNSITTVDNVVFRNYYFINGNIRCKRVYSVSIDDSTSCICESGNVPDHKIINRIRTLYDIRKTDGTRKYNSIYVIIYVDSTTQDSFHQKYNIDKMYSDIGEYSFVNLDTVAEWTPPTSTIVNSIGTVVSAPVQKITRSHIELFKMIPSLGGGSNVSRFWEDADFLTLDSTKTYIYIPIYKYKIKSNGDILKKIANKETIVGEFIDNENRYDLGALSEFLGMLMKYDNTRSIYGVRAKDVPDLGSNWKPFDDEIDTICTTILSDTKILEDLSIYYTDSHGSRLSIERTDVSTYVNTLGEMLKETSVGLLLFIQKKIETLRDSGRWGEVRSVFRILEWCDSVYKTAYCNRLDIYNIERLRQNVLTLYPLLDTILSGGYVQNNTIADSAVSYILGCNILKGKHLLTI